MEESSVTVHLQANSQSGSMHMLADVSFLAPNLDSALRLIRRAVGDAFPTFVDPDAGTNTTLRRAG